MVTVTQIWPTGQEIVSAERGVQRKFSLLLKWLPLDSGCFCGWRGSLKPQLPSCNHPERVAPSEVRELPAVHGKDHVFLRPLQSAASGVSARKNEAEREREGGDRESKIHAERREADMEKNINGKKKNVHFFVFVLVYFPLRGSGGKQIEARGK